MTNPAQNYNDPRLVAVDADFSARRNRFFITFAVIEGIVLLGLVLAIYVLDLIDREMGVWILVAVAILGGFTLTSQMTSLAKQHQRARKDVTGEI